MIGMVLVTHEHIGAELIKALNGIVGPQKQVEAIRVGPQEEMSQCRDRILAAVQNVNSGQGVAIMVDMFGGTPSNLAISSMPMVNAVVLAGVNLPMLVKLATVRAKLPLIEAAREAETAGRKYIQLVAENIAPQGGPASGGPKGQAA